MGKQELTSQLMVLDSAKHKKYSTATGTQYIRSVCKKSSRVSSTV